MSDVVRLCSGADSQQTHQFQGYARDYQGKPEYFVKWLGYPLSQSTWEPLKNLQFVKDMLEEYEEQVERQPAKI